MTRSGLLTPAIFLFGAFCSIGAWASELTPITYQGSCLWSHMNDICFAGDYAYCAMHHGLMVVDISDPANPVTVYQHYISEGEGNDIAIAGQYAYLCCRAGGLKIFDISDPAAPVLAGEHKFSFRAEFVAVRGSYAYIADYLDKLRVLDISDPAAPVETAKYTVDFFGIPVNLIAVDDRLYCRSYKGLRIFDISDPVTLVEISYYSPAATPRALAIDDTLAYLLDDSSLTIINVSPPGAPEVVGYLSYGFTSFDMRDIEVIGSYAYTAHGEYEEVDGSGGIIIVDVSDPTAPAIVNQLESTVYLLARADDRLCASDMYSFFDILSLAAPAEPTAIGTVQMPVSSFYGMRGVITDGSYAYVAYGKGGIQIVDVTDPAAPTVGASGIIPNRAFELTRDGRYLYVAANAYEGEGLKIIDVSNPAHPVVIGSYPYPSPQEVTIHENYAFLGGNNGRAIILDISKPGAPALVSQYRVGGITFGIAVTDRYAYLANWVGLITVDITDVASPVVLDTISYLHAAYDAVIYKGYLVVSTTEGLSIYDIATDPSVPAPAASLSIGSDCYGLTPYGQYLLVAAGYYDGIVIVDMTLPLLPKIIGSQTISGNVQSVTAFGNTIFAVDQFGFMSFSSDLPECCLMGGDVDLDGNLDIGDVIRLVNYIFKGGPPPGCPKSADANANCTIDVGDPVRLIDYLLRQGLAPDCSGCL